MTVSLPLVSPFLRQHFSGARLLLLGYPITPVIEVSEVTVFDGSVDASSLVAPISVEPALSRRLAVPRLRPTWKAPSKRVIQWALSGVVALALVISAVVFTPQLYYKVFPADVVPVKTQEQGTPIGGDFDQGAQVQPVQQRVLPPQDPSLPEGTWLIIPRIGVRTQLDPSLTEEEALAKGVWMAPDYGIPGDKTQPVILAAHRYGWQWWWKTDYWKYHSFYLLPDLQPGDMVEVIDDQRKYYYEIYAGEEGEEITDYTADMILYTCKFLNSPLRHFRYARIVDMSKDTQQS